MNLKIEKIDDFLVKQIIGWRYDGEYCIYNFPSYDIIKEQNWSIVNPEKQDEFRVVYNNNYLIGWFRFQKNNENILGLGMNPEICGHGLGKDFVMKIIEFLNEDIINLEVRDFNKRAISCYKKCGFKEIDRYSKKTLVGSDNFIKMQYRK